jgi:hypothetical protein
MVAMHLISRCGIRDKLLRGSRPRRQNGGTSTAEMVLCLAHVTTCCMRREPWRQLRYRASKQAHVSLVLPPTSHLVCVLCVLLGTRATFSREMGHFPGRGTRTCLFRQVASTFGWTPAVRRHLCVSPAVKQVYVLVLAGTGAWERELCRYWIGTQEMLSREVRSGLCCVLLIVLHLLFCRRPVPFRLEELAFLLDRRAVCM